MRTTSGKLSQKPVLAFLHLQGLLSLSLGNSSFLSSCLPLPSLRICSHLPLFRSQNAAPFCDASHLFYMPVFFLSPLGELFKGHLFSAVFFYLLEPFPPRGRKELLTNSFRYRNPPFKAFLWVSPFVFMNNSS